MVFAKVSTQRPIPPDALARFGAIVMLALLLFFGTSATVRATGIARATLLGVRLHSTPEDVIAALVKRGYRAVGDPHAGPDPTKRFERLPTRCASKALSLPTPVPPGHKPYPGACTGAIIARGRTDPNLAITFAEDPARPGTSLVKSVEATHLYDVTDAEGPLDTLNRLTAKFGKPTENSQDASGGFVVAWCARTSCPDSPALLTYTSRGTGRLFFEDRPLEAADRAAELRRFSRPTTPIP